MPPRKQAHPEKLGRRRSRPVQIYFYESEFNDLALIAAQRGISKSEQVRRWVITVIGQYRSGRKDPRQTELRQLSDPKLITYRRCKRCGKHVPEKSLLHELCRDCRSRKNNL